MTHEELKEKGIFVGEDDILYDGLYNGSDYYYLYNDTLYCRHEPTNTVTYDGEISTRKIMPDVKETLQSHNEDFWVELCGREAYEKLREIYSKQEQASKKHKQTQQIAIVDAAMQNSKFKPKEQKTVTGKRRC